MKTTPGCTVSVTAWQAASGAATSPPQSVPTLVGPAIR
jgi:hypothetical protein